MNAVAAKTTEKPAQKETPSAHITVRSETVNSWPIIYAIRPELLSVLPPLDC